MGSAQGVASSDTPSGAIMGDVPKTVTEINHEETVDDDVDCRTPERIGRRLINAILHVRFPPGR